jgi:hypothetical protein
MTELTDRQFMAKYGFWPHQELCTCGWPRGLHTANNDPEFKCSEEKFVGTGKK